MTDTTPKKKVPGRPFPKGTSGNPKGINRYTAMKTIEQSDEMFLEELFKEVDALEKGQVVKATQHKLFMQQLIVTGIKGRAIDRKLVLQHFAAVEARKKVLEAERGLSPSSRLPINSQINGPTISRTPAIQQVAFTGRVRRAAPSLSPSDKINENWEPCRPGSRRHDRGKLGNQTRTRHNCG